MEFPSEKLLLLCEILSKKALHSKSLVQAHGTWNEGCQGFYMSIGQIEIRLKPSGNQGLGYLLRCNDGKLVCSGCKQTWAYCSLQSSSSVKKLRGSANLCKRILTTLR